MHGSVNVFVGVCVCLRGCVHVRVYMFVDALKALMWENSLRASLSRF